MEVELPVIFPDAVTCWVNNPLPVTVRPVEDETVPVKPLGPCGPTGPCGPKDFTLTTFVSVLVVTIAILLLYCYIFSKFDFTL